MTNDSVVEAARKVLRRALDRKAWREQGWEAPAIDVQEALDLLEKAHAPNDDEREAARQYADSQYPELCLAPENEDLADAAERAFLAGAAFRRSEVPEPQGEPTDEQIEAGAKALRDDKANRVDAYAVPAWENTSYGDKLLYRGQSLAVLRAVAENNEREEKP